MTPVKSAVRSRRISDPDAFLIGTQAEVLGRRRETKAPARYGLRCPGLVPVGLQLGFVSILRNSQPKERSKHPPRSLAFSDEGSMGKGNTHDARGERFDEGEVANCSGTA